MSVWRVGVAGRRWLRSQGLEPAKSPVADAHTLGIVREWVGIAKAASILGFHLERVVPDWELRASSGGCSELIPDLLVDLRIRERNLRIAVELDRGGHEPLKVLARKMARYRLRPDWTVAVAVEGAGPRRRANIAKMLEAHPGLSVLWADEGPGQALSALAESLVSTTSHPVDQVEASKSVKNQRTALANDADLRERGHVAELRGRDEAK